MARAPRHLGGLELAADQTPAAIVPERRGQIDRRDAHRGAELDDPGGAASARHHVEEAAIAGRDREEISGIAAIDPPVIRRSSARMSATICSTLAPGASTAAIIALMRSRSVASASSCSLSRTRAAGPLLNAFTTFPFNAEAREGLDRVLSIG
ncbi:MAG: hypothetical protein WDN24_13370 [Sphingomonas sp.]